MITLRTLSFSLFRLHDITCIYIILFTQFLDKMRGWNSIVGSNGVFICFHICIYIHLKWSYLTRCYKHSKGVWHYIYTFWIKVTVPPEGHISRTQHLSRQWCGWQVGEHLAKVGTQRSFRPWHQDWGGGHVRTAKENMESFPGLCARLWVRDRMPLCHLTCQG